VSVLVVIASVAAVVIAVVFVAMGRGGEMSVERPDYEPLDLGPVSATDVALLRPPGALWGYSMAATDEAMARIAESIRDRDVRIVALEQLVSDLSREPAQPVTLSSPPYVGARHRRETDDVFGSAVAGGAGQAAPSRDGRDGRDDGQLPPPEQAHD
jgi:hypothetical protein